MRVHQPTFKARIHLHQDQHRILKLNKKKNPTKRFLNLQDIQQHHPCRGVETDAGPTKQQIKQC